MIVSLKAINYIAYRYNLCYNDFMSQRLIILMEKKIEREGPIAKLHMAAVIFRSAQMIDRYLRGVSTPRPETARLLAIECGANEKEAAAIERDCFRVSKPRHTG